MAMLEQCRQLANEMRLLGMAESLAARANEAIAENLQPTEFLRLVLQDEKLSRKNRAGQTLITKARFRTNADLEDWEDTYERGLSKVHLKDLATMSFMRNRENVIVYGKTGEGKTHLAIALGRRICREGYRTSFYSVNLMFNELAAERAAGHYLKFIRRLAKDDVLILDDFGLRNYNHDEAQILLDILEERYRKGVCIVTSQVDSRGWGKLFEDSVISEAIIERLIKPSKIITLKGGSYRDRLQQKCQAKT